MRCSVVFFLFTVFLVAVSLLTAQPLFSQEASQPSALVVVTAESVEIKTDGNGVAKAIGTAPRNARLWAVDGRAGQTLVIDPASSQQGWVPNSAIQVVQEPPIEAAKAQSQFNQAMVNANAGNFGQAQQHFKQAVALLERSVGPEHPQIPPMLKLTAQMHNRLGEFKQAETCLTKALGLSRKYAGAGHATTLKYLGEFAQCYEIQMRFDKACEMRQQAVDASTKSVGRKHPQTASMLVQLANTQFDDAQYVGAKKTSLEAWEIRKQVLGVEHDSTQSIAGGLGRAYYALGQPAKAVETLEQCCAILRKKHGRVPASQSFILTYLGFAYQSLDEYERAEQCLLSLYKIDCETHGVESKEALNSLHNLATLAHANADDESSEELFLQCLQGRVNVLGEDHHHTMATLWSLGNLYLENGNYEKAETYLVRVLRLAEKNGDTIHDSPYHLGKLYSDTGRHEFGEALIRNAIKQQAERKQNPDGHMLSALAEVQVRMGAIDKAIATQDRARRSATDNLKNVLVGMPKAKRELFLANGFASDLHTAFSLTLKRANDPKVAASSAEWLLNGKVVGQEVIAEASLLSTPEAAPFVTALRKVRDQLAAIVIQADAQDARTKQRFAKLLETQKVLELKVAEFGTGRFADQGWQTLEQLRSQLTDESRFVSIAKVKIRDFAKSQESTKWKETKYIAWIVPPAGGGDIKLVDLGPAKTIDADVVKLRKELTGDFFARNGERGDVENEKQYRQVAQSLSEKVLRPLEEFVGDAKEIIISPDSELWRVPWEALILSNEDYLVQSYRLRYVLSGRDLLPKAKSAATKNKDVTANAPVIFASPNYDFTSPGKASKNPGAKRRSGSMHFQPLPGTAVEAANIKPSIEKFAKQPSQVLLEDEATESTFKKLQRPRVLVLSTHGYFLPDRPVSAGKSRKPSISPMLRCGLALAGSNHPFADDQSTDDGVLTGLEIVGSDLRGTELVVLSACETGLGEIQSGEGVAGLRQAFQLAGAASVVSSLWQVSDRETVALMTLFFENIADGQPKPVAMRRAQLDRIAARSKRNGAAHPFYWAAFTLTGQP